MERKRFKQPMTPAQLSAFLLLGTENDRQGKKFLDNKKYSLSAKRNAVKEALDDEEREIQARLRELEGR